MQPSRLQPRCLTAFVTHEIVKLEQTFGFVMADASCMVDMGMQDFFQSLLRFGMPSNAHRVSMMFMNSMVNPDSLALSKEVLHEPVVVRVMPAGRTSPHFLRIEDGEKLSRLKGDLQEWLGGRKRILVWVHSRARAQFLTEHFYSEHIACAALCKPTHDWQDWQKKRIWRQFCDGVIKVIFTTDAGCNGLDISAVDVLLHYDLPSRPEILSLRTNRLRIWNAKVIMYVSPSDHQEVISALASLSDVVPDWLTALTRQSNEESDLWQSEAWDRHGWNGNSGNEWWQTATHTSWQRESTHQENGWNERWGEWDNRRGNWQ